jgi:hypothetical protein
LADFRPDHKDELNRRKPSQRASNEGLKTASVKGGSRLAIPQIGELLFVQGDARDSLQLRSNIVDLVTSFLPQDR